MKKFLLFAFFFALVFGTSAQQYTGRVGYEKTMFSDKGVRNITSLQIDTISSIQTIINMFFGPGVQISNFSYTGAPLAIGTFLDTTGTLGIDTGLVMTTGSVFNVPGPNMNGGTGMANGTPGDISLNALGAGWVTYDAAVLEFDFIPMTDTVIASEMVFGSEEYPEYAGSPFNDVFAFFISGPGFSGLQNIAYIPGTTTAVSINNVNHFTNSNFYINNNGGLLLEYDGYTVPMPFAHPIQPGQTYHFKIAIADVADMIFDSGIFLKKSSFRAHAKTPLADFSYTLNGLTVEVDNLSSSAQSFRWDFGDGTIISDSSGASQMHTYAATGNYDIKLTAWNFFKADSMTQSISIIGTGISDHIHAPDNIRIHTLADGQYKFSGMSLPAGQLVISSITGQVFPSAGLFSNGILNLRDLPKGIYFVKIPAANLAFKVVN